MPRIYLPLVFPEKKQIIISDDKARYLTTVLRCRTGDDLVIFNGTGQCLHAVISEITRKQVTVQVIEKYPCNLESPVNIHLMQGILKGGKMDFVIQKTTELGIKEITPFISERGTVRETGKTDRWRKIAEEASRQSGRNRVPLIHAPVSFRNLFQSQSGVQRQGCIFYEEGGVPLKSLAESLSVQPAEILILIGPEGGFTGDEVAIAKEHGFFIASLGKRILRAETAAISAVTLVQYLFGDLG
jgi:16S rRNA (uracil1498-N3)-methyltransferase